MAGDWLKFDKTTPDKPEVFTIAGKLGIDPDAVVGKLLRVWSWFDSHTDDGNASVTVAALLDRITGVTGFIETTVQAGWLMEKDGQLSVSNFSRHNGQTAKTRALGKNRAASHRSESNAESNDPIVTPPLPEKRREEYKEKPFAPAPVLPFDSPEFAAAWTRWLAYNREKKKKMPATTTALQLKKLAKFGELPAIASIEASMENNWTGLFEVKASKPAIRPTSEPTPLRSLYD